MNKQTGISRRRVLASAGTAAAGLFLGTGATAPVAATTATASTTRKTDDLAQLVRRTSFVDTHEPLVEEDRRTQWSKPDGRLPCHDWALLFSHYLNSDLQVAGLSAKDQKEFLAPTTPSERKWALVEPHWPAVKNTGYGQVVRIAARQLYGVDDLNARTVPRFAEGYQRLVKPGFYAAVLHRHAGVESCQVNSLDAPFSESRQPLLLMQDISILSFGSTGGDPWNRITDAAGQKATDLAGWHRMNDAVIDLCWAWIISPTASERFVRDFLVTAPANKLLTFGGDYIPVECVVGHAALARRGLTRALQGLVADGWLSRADALDLVEPLMRGNARRIFQLEEKERVLRTAPWAT